jgi:tRNA-splicing ligase RtcB
MEIWNGPLERLDENRWLITRDYKKGMKVPGLIFASETLIKDIRHDQACEQVANVAFLPGITGYSMAMPDIHWGYGFPIGGVAAMRLSDGVVSPGGVGFDINCGVRMLRTNLTEGDVRPRIKEVAQALFSAVPSGVGASGRVWLTKRDIDNVLLKGARWAVEQGLGRAEDLDVTEENGEMKECDPAHVSYAAKERGADQLGTLGSGNHFLQLDAVDHIYDNETAKAMGLTGQGQIVVLIHCGSRGLGHQVATDYIQQMVGVMQRFGLSLPDRQLAAAPLSSPEGKAYLSAMRCAANYAWANRQCITHRVRQSFSGATGIDESDAGLELIYDVCHNIAKMEEHTHKGNKDKFCVHRKGATRAFPPGHPDIPKRYAGIGQPVLIPGDMGRCSFVLVGTEKAMSETFGSTCHGAGRAESRAEAKRRLTGREVLRELEGRGIVVMSGSLRGLAEEASSAYKDINQVVEAVQNAGISKLVARTRPVAVVKG